MMHACTHINASVNGGDYISYQDQKLPGLIMCLTKRSDNANAECAQRSNASKQHSAPRARARAGARAGTTTAAGGSTGGAAATTTRCTPQPGKQSV